MGKIKWARILALLFAIYGGSTTLPQLGARRKSHREEQDMAEVSGRKVANVAQAREDDVCGSSYENDMEKERDEEEDVISGKEDELCLLSSLRQSNAPGARAPALSIFKSNGSETNLSAGCSFFHCDDVTTRAFATFLLTPVTAGGTLYFIYDDFIPRTRTWLSVVRTLGLGIAVFRPEDFLGRAENVLRSSDIKRLFVFCSEQNIFRIFQKVRDRALESRTAQWYIVGDREPARELEQVLREGTQAMTAAQTSQNSFDLFVTRVGPDGVVRFRRLGNWRTSGGVSAEELRETLFPPLRELYRDFGGRTLRAAVVPSRLYFIADVLPNGDVQVVGGVDAEVLNTLSSALNFTYRLVVPDDKQWGTVDPDGTITGMIGLVARQEVDLVCDATTITANRETAVDFTRPYIFDKTSIISKAPGIRERTWAVLQPFTVKVWVCLLVSTALMGPITYLVLWLHSKKWGYLLPSYPDVMLNTFRSMVAQGDLLPLRGLAPQTLSGSWYYFAFIVGTLYSAQLMTFLVTPVRDEPIDTIGDVLSAARTRDYYVTVVKGSVTHEFLKTITFGKEEELWGTIIRLRYDFDYAHEFSDSTSCFWRMGKDKLSEGFHFLVGVSTARSRLQNSISLD